MSESSDKHLSLMVGSEWYQPLFLVVLPIGVSGHFFASSTDFISYKFSAHVNLPFDIYNPFWCYCTMGMMAYGVVMGSCLPYFWLHQFLHSTMLQAILWFVVAVDFLIPNAILHLGVSS